MLIYSEEIKRTKHRTTRRYAEHFKRCYKEFESAMDRDRFLTAEEFWNGA
jgi:ATP-dependent Clp protease protease subunit